MADLAAAMHGGEVDTLLALDANPVYAAPAELDVIGALSKVRRTVHAGLYQDETALRSDWHLPLTHPLESWGDARAVDGTITLLQPTVAPFFGGRSVPQILSTLVDPAPLDGQQLLQAHWQSVFGQADFAPRWHQALLDGFVRDSALPEVAAAPSTRAAGCAACGSAGGDRRAVSPGPDGVGRRRGEQCLAAGTAEAFDQGGLGERNPGGARVGAARASGGW